MSQKRNSVELDSTVWKKGSGNNSGLYSCRICVDGIWRNAKNCNRHFSSQKHKKAAEFYEETRNSLFSAEDRLNLPGSYGHPLSSNFSDGEGATQLDLLGDHTPQSELGFIEVENVYQDVTPDSLLELGDLDGDLSEHSDNNIDTSDPEIDWIAEGPQVEENTYSDDETELPGDQDDVPPATNASNICSPAILNSLSMTNDSNEWFPWPNKLYCILDILRNLPRSTLSEKQHGLVLWSLRSLGIFNVPSETTVKSVIDSIQYMCGVKTIRYKGALGHVYYVNDLSALIAQEMANPKVRPHIQVYPEDAESHLENANQGRRWLHELDADLLTPMMRRGEQDFYIFEPAILNDGSVVMPIRWFKYRGNLYAIAWKLTPGGLRNVDGWFVYEFETFRIPGSQFSVSFPYFCESFHYRELPDPRCILGVRDSVLGKCRPWTRTDPSKGNKWRELSKGHFVYAFPIWLYCDDTSGNQSKKWNEHNSYLFTPAGLPREYLHRQYNVHFLCTSNIAPPLEMLDGIVDQLTYAFAHLLCQLHMNIFTDKKNRIAQKHGIWAWDHIVQDSVLLIPSVLGLLGDNPMQSEFACHIGMNGNLFCRICVATFGNTKSQEKTPGSAAQPNNRPTNSNGSPADSNDDNRSDNGSVNGAIEDSNAAQPRVINMSEWVKRARAFLKIHTYRCKKKTLENIEEIYKETKRIGGKSKSLKLKTKYGVKDKYLDHFGELIFSHADKLEGKLTEKQIALNQYIKSLPSNTLSPVWRIKDLDPHTDTPVEILHVVLLGFVKYLWRDAIARLNDQQKRLVTIRLNSVNTLGLNLSPLAGKTLVQYSGSLTGRDFRALAQVSPFVLHGLLPLPCFRAWLALSFLIPLLYQPAIYNVRDYMIKVENGINLFLDSIAAWTPRWFNKPKFHILLHLVEHIKRFGPPHTFATEAFESYNALIRDLSVHSNRQAPSRDIGYGFANANRIRHLLSGGKFLTCEGTIMQGDAVLPQTSNIGSPPLRSSQLRSVGPKVLELIEQDNILKKLCGYLIEEQKLTGDREFKVKTDRLSVWTNTFSSKVIEPHAASQSGFHKLKYHFCKSCCLENDEECSINQFVVIRSANPGPFAIGKVVEMLQVYNSVAELERRPSLFLISLYSTSSVDSLFLMPALTSTGRYALVDFKDVLCAVNTQHNCAKNNCQANITKSVYQEREKTRKLDPELDHSNPDDLLLNCAQMRSSHYIQLFHSPPRPIDREIAIHEGAAREIEIQRTKQKKGKSKAKEKGVNDVEETEKQEGNKTKKKTGNSALSASMPAQQIMNNVVASLDYRQGSSTPSSSRNNHNAPRFPPAQIGYQYTSRSHIPLSGSSYLGSRYPTNFSNNFHTSGAQETLPNVTNVHPNHGTPLRPQFLPYTPNRYA